MSRITKELGLNSKESLLHAQVRSGDPEMKIDADGRLRHANFPGAEGSLYLGDIGDALLRCFGVHEPPRVTEIPGFDQQIWRVIISDVELSVTIESRPYWGFGLFSSCFLNSIHMVGPLNRRARLVFDLCASLGRNPWEAKWMGRFIKSTNISLSDFGVPSANLSMGTKKVINVVDPTSAQDAATKNYVDTTFAGSGALIYQGGYDATTAAPTGTSMPYF